MMNECVESVDERIHPGFLPSESRRHVVIGALHVRRGTLDDLANRTLDNGVENDICRRVQEILCKSHMGQDLTSKRHNKADDDAAVLTRGDASMAKNERPVNGGREKMFPLGSPLRTVALDRILNSMDTSMDTSKSIDTKPMQTKSFICGTKSVDNKSMDSSKSIDGSMYMGSNSLTDLYGCDRWTMDTDYSQGEGSFRRTETIRRVLENRDQTPSQRNKTIHSSVSGKAIHSSVSGKAIHSSVSRKTRKPKSDLANFMNAVTNMVEEQGNKDFKIERDGDVLTLQLITK